MADSTENDVEMAEDDYDEEADSDFDAASAHSEGSKSPSEDDDDADAQATKRSTKRQKTKPADESIELDSGDEATIKEHKKARKRRQKKGEDVEDDGNESESWKARTRAMRERDKEERKQNKLASIKGSTIDVDKLWEEMNRPGPLPPFSVIPTDDTAVQQEPISAKNVDKENVDVPEMITIKRTYKFAGDVHTEVKSVPKDSAEAKLWLAQQSEKSPALDAEGKVIQRPLRKFSRFDPNHSNLDAFKGSWSLAQKTTGPKLNVVEKSKMDWAVHVDAEGLQDELSDHAKSKNSYLHQSDFLRSVSQRKDDEAREARLRGK